MTRNALLAVSAAVSVFTLSAAAEAGGKCLLRGDRAEARTTTATVHRTDRTFQRLGDRLARTGDRLFSWTHKRPRS